MASLPTRTTASFDAIKPVSSLVLLDNEFNQYVGAAGIFNGGTSATKLLVKASDATDPPIEIDQIGAGPLAEWKQNGSLKASIENDGDLLANGITGAAGIYTFGSIPLGPAADPTTANQLARKDYIDSRKVSFAACFGINDPSTANLNTSDFGTLLIPSGGVYTLTFFKVFYVGGLHTAGGDITFTLIKQGVGNLTSVDLDNTNNAANAVYPSAFGVNTQAADTLLTVQISARTGTITERNVTCVIEGNRTLF
jgi:hypothetical protein